MKICSCRSLCKKTIDTYSTESAAIKNLVIFSIVDSGQNLVELNRVGPNQNLAKSVLAQISHIRLR